MKEIQGHFDPNTCETEGNIKVCGCQQREEKNINESEK